MRILILGAGNAGRQLALRLCEEKHSVVMVDSDPTALAIAEAKLDLLTVCGQASSPRVLAEAQVERCHLVIAVTNCDEANILACLYANAAGVPRKIARVSSPEYMHSDDTYDLKAMGIDLVINQKRECAREIYNSLKMPAAVEAFDLFAGKVMAAGFRLGPMSPLVGSTPARCSRSALIEKIRIIAIQRGTELLIPRGDTQFERGDLVYLVGKHHTISEFAEWVCPRFEPIQKLIIAGGGDLGLMLAREVEDSVECVLLEQDEERARFCSAKLNKTLVLRADALAESTLEETGVTGRTAFVALTGDDENNIMNCLMAKKQGVGFTLTQITRTDYVPVIESLSLVNRVVSPYISTTHGILHYLRSQDVQAASLLHNLPGELLDVVLQEESKLVGQMIQDVKMPRQAVIATIMRGQGVVAATGGLTLEAGDRLLVFSHHDAVKKIKAAFCK